MYNMRRKTRRIVKVFLTVMLSILVITLLFAWELRNASLTGKSVNENNAEEYSIVGNIVGANFKEFNNVEFYANKNDLKDYREMELKVLPGQVTLRDKCAKLSVSTTLEKTERLIKSIDGSYGMRPEEHDIIDEVLDVFEITVDYVAIEDIKDEIFYAHLIMHDGERVLNLDVRPSDGIAIAAKKGAPIYVNEALLEEFAEITC